MAAIRVGLYSLHVYGVDVDPQDLPECSIVVCKYPGNPLTEDDKQRAIAKAKRDHAICCPGCFDCKLSRGEKVNADKV